MLAENFFNKIFLAPSCRHNSNVWMCAIFKAIVFHKQTKFHIANKNTHSYGLSWCDENNFYKIYIGSETVNFCLMNQSVYGNRRVRTLFIIFFIFILKLCGLFKRYILTFLCWSVRTFFLLNCVVKWMKFGTIMGWRDTY